MRASAAGGPAGAHPFSSVADIVCKGEQDGPGSFTVETSFVQQSGLTAAGSLDCVRGSTGEPILCPDAGCWAADHWRPVRRTPLRALGAERLQKVGIPISGATDELLSEGGRRSPLRVRAGRSRLRRMLRQRRGWEAPRRTQKAAGAGRISGSAEFGAKAQTRAVMGAGCQTKWCPHPSPMGGGRQA